MAVETSSSVHWGTPPGRQRKLSNAIGGSAIMLDLRHGCSLAAVICAKAKSPAQAAYPCGLAGWPNAQTRGRHPRAKQARERRREDPRIHAVTWSSCVQTFSTGPGIFPSVRSFALSLPEGHPFQSLVSSHPLLGCRPSPPQGGRSVASPAAPILRPLAKSDCRASGLAVISGLQVGDWPGRRWRPDLPPCGG